MEHLRDLCGKPVYVEVLDGKCRLYVNSIFESLGSISETEKAHIRKNAHEEHMRVSFQNDGTLTVEAAHLVLWDTADELLVQICDKTQTRMETMLAQANCSVEATSFGWNFGHSETDWDDLMTEEEQAIAKACYEAGY